MVARRGFECSSGSKNGSASTKWAFPIDWAVVSQTNIHLVNLIYKFSANDLFFAMALNLEPWAITVTGRERKTRGTEIFFENSGVRTKGRGIWGRWDVMGMQGGCAASAHTTPNYIAAPIRHNSIAELSAASKRPTQTGRTCWARARKRKTLKLKTTFPDVNCILQSLPNFRIAHWQKLHNFRIAQWQKLHNISIEYWQKINNFWIWHWQKIS